MKLRFVGTRLEIVGFNPLEQFGQAVTLPDALAKELLGPVSGFGLDQRAAALLTEAEFDDIGFTPEELKNFADIGTHADAPAAFLVKKRAALARLAAQPKVTKGDK